MPRKPLVDTPQEQRTGQHIGRPRKKPPEDAVQRIQTAAAHGFSVVGVALELGTNADVLRRWFDEYPEMKQAFEAGREQERHTLHNKLYRDATEGTGKDSLLAAMFLLKARHGYKEGESPAEQGNSRVQINIQLPASLPPAQWAEVVENG